MRKLHLELVISKPDEKNVVGSLFRVFLEEENEANVFHALNGTLTMDFFSEKISKEMIEVVSLIPSEDVKELLVKEVQVDNTAENHNPEAQVEVIETKNTEMEADVQEEVPEPEVEVEVEEKPSPQKTSRRIVEVDGAGHAIFEEIAEKSETLEDFIENFSSFLGMTGEGKKFFIELMKTACKCQTSDMKTIENNISVEYREKVFSYRKNVCSQKIKAAFEPKGSNVRFLLFVSEFVKYSKRYLEKPEKKENPKFDLLTINMVNGALKYEGFSDRVRYILDMVKDGGNDSHYLKYRERFVKVIVKTARAIGDGQDWSEALNNSAKEVMGADNVHIAKAFVLQFVKDCCKRVGFDDKDPLKEVVFFGDLVNLM